MFFQDCEVVVIDRMRNLSTTAKILVALVGVPVLVGVSVFGYWTISPLFYDRVVNESLDDAIAQAAMQRSVAQDEESSSAEDDSGGENGQTTVLFTGNFVGGDDAHPALGTANVIDIGEGQRILRFEEGFEVSNGPDLYVWLAKEESPGEDYIDLGVLKGNKGSQNYEIPADTHLSEYDNVLIWCKAFSVLFGSAMLTDATVMPEEPMASTGGEVDIVSTGEFEGADASHEAMGMANIIALNEDTHILRFEEGFEVTNGPDLYVWLTVDGDTNKGLIDLGKLKGNVGSQNYTLPDEEIDFSEFDTVLIWCKAFNVLFGTAVLELTSE